MSSSSIRPPSPSPSVLPPAYEPAQLPNETTVYMFSPEGFNNMLLVPPSNLPDSQPRYHISVALNVWNPLSFITVVRRGGTDSGPIVGEFEMDISTLPGTISVGDDTKFLRETIVDSERNSKFLWTFRADKRQHIHWERAVTDAGFLYTCFLVSPQVKLAQYLGPTVKKRNRSTPLTVFPEGQRYLDDIVLSILVVERRRFRPSPPKTTSVLEQHGHWWSA
uniref:DUF6593 domain-containing protein n=1 Tax=Mycena chlorophos TaxID=658473 RepID=A0ABQ0LSR7_MYCCL|nr:predicted protein [Mycena chlorophos]